eukprot:scaffold2563_cov124-Cylindrotheca_fusiformis.AAC.20
MTVSIASTKPLVYDIMGFQQLIQRAPVHSQVHSVHIPRFPADVALGIWGGIDTFSGQPHSQSKKQFHDCMALEMNRAGENDNDTDVFTSLVDKIVNTVTMPTPLISPSLAIGYPALLVGCFLGLPLPTASLLLVFFAVYAYIGRQFVLNDYLEEQESTSELEEEDDESRPNTDLLAFGSAVVCTALFAPDAVTNIDNTVSPLIFALLAIIAVPLLLGESGWIDDRIEPSAEEGLMSLWDKELDDQDQRK